MPLNETNEPAAAPLSAGDLAIYELSRGIGNPAVMFGHGKTIESAVVEQALQRIERAETALRELQGKERPETEEQTRWPISAQFLMCHGMLRRAMEFSDFGSSTPEELMEQNVDLYLTRDELKKLEEAI